MNQQAVFITGKAGYNADKIIAALALIYPGRLYPHIECKDNQRILSFGITINPDEDSVPSVIKKVKKYYKCDFAEPAEIKTVYTIIKAEIKNNINYVKDTSSPYDKFDDAFSEYNKILSLAGEIKKDTSYILARNIVLFRKVSRTPFAFDITPVYIYPASTSSEIRFED